MNREIVGNVDVLIEKAEFVKAIDEALGYGEGVREQYGHFRYVAYSDGKYLNEYVVACRNGGKDAGDYVYIVNVHIDSCSSILVDVGKAIGARRECEYCEAVAFLEEYRKAEWRLED